MDIVNIKKRSEMMAGIGSKDTKPEIRVRKFLHANGFRFRLHRKDLPGKPDIVLPKLNTIIFVNGCFWHRHNCKKGRHLPKSNAAFWKDKLEKNKIRDRKNAKILRDSGWQVLIIWECQTGDDAIMERIVNNKLC